MKKIILVAALVLLVSLSGCTSKQDAGHFWEEIGGYDHDIDTYKATIPEGTLYMTSLTGGYNAVAMVFVPKTIGS